MTEVNQQQEFPYFEQPFSLQDQKQQQQDEQNRQKKNSSDSVSSGMQNSNAKGSFDSQNESSHLEGYFKQFCQKLESEGTIERLALIKQNFNKEQQEIFNSQKMSNQKRTQELLLQQQEKVFQEKKLKREQSRLSYQKLCELYCNKNPTSVNKQFQKLMCKKIKQAIIPEKLRRQIWLQCSNASYQIFSQNKGYYQALKKMDYPDYFDQLITLDLYRTPTFIKLKKGDKQPSKFEVQKFNRIYNVLKMTARRNANIGYCQGMNFIVGFLNSMFFTEEEMFWILQELLENIIPIDYYTTMTGVQCDQRIFSNLLKFINPQVHKKFEDLCIDPSFFTTQWFVALYTNQVPSQTMQVIFDHLLIKGSVTIFKVALLILDYCKEDIIQAESFPDVITIVENKSQTIKDYEKFNSDLSKLCISKKIINICREIHSISILKEREEYMDKLKDKIITKQNIKCSHDWAICKSQMSSDKNYRNHNQHFVFQAYATIEIFNENHFQINCPSQENTCQSSQNESDREKQFMNQDEIEVDYENEDDEEDEDDYDDDEEEDNEEENDDDGFTLMKNCKKSLLDIKKRALKNQNSLSQNNDLYKSDEIFRPKLRRTKTRTSFVQNMEKSQKHLNITRQNHICIQGEEFKSEINKIEEFQVFESCKQPQDADNCGNTNGSQLLIKPEQRHKKNDQDIVRGRNHQVRLSNDKSITIRIDTENPLQNSINLQKNIMQQQTPCLGGEINSNQDGTTSSDQQKNINSQTNLITRSRTQTLPHNHGRTNKFVQSECNVMRFQNMETSPQQVLGQSIQCRQPLNNRGKKKKNSNKIIQKFQMQQQRLFPEIYNQNYDTSHNNEDEGVYYNGQNCLRNRTRGKSVQVQCSYNQKDVKIVQNTFMKDAKINKEQLNKLMLTSHNFKFLTWLVSDPSKKF